MINHLPPDAVHRLQSNLTEKRFRHSVGVYETCFLLADHWKNYPVDPEQLAWASLFHDCAKELKPDEIGKIVNNGLLPIGLELLAMPQLVHAPMGANVLKQFYNIHDEMTLSAVAYHPTGNRSLSPIGWMVYVADYLEPNRTYMENREELLEEACKDPLIGLRMITDLRIQKVQEKGREVNPLALEFKTYLDSIDSL